MNAFANNSSGSLRIQAGLTGGHGSDRIAGPLGS
jgi:hypothetical protein